MSVRSCVYHGCENYSLNGVPHGHYVIFAFPKNYERRELWMQLGNVDRNLPQKALFMCSEHFEKKYISANQFRTLLLGSAVPIQYKEEINDEQSNHSNEEVTENIKTILQSDPELLAEDERIESNGNNNASEYEETVDFENLDDCDNSNFTIHFEKDDETTIREIRINKSPSRTAKGCYYNRKKTANVTLNNKSDSEAATKVRKIDKVESDISTFIYNGKEYIQMPKDVYLQERNDLLFQINSYKTLFKNIKEKLMNFEEF